MSLNKKKLIRHAIYLPQLYPGVGIGRMSMYCAYPSLYLNSLIYSGAGKAANG